MQWLRRGAHLAALLEAAERCRGVDDQEAVHPDRAGVQAAGGGQGPAGVAGANPGGQAVCGRQCTVKGGGWWRAELQQARSSCNNIM